jgi:hypothetical protein
MGLTNPSFKNIVIWDHILITIYSLGGGTMSNNTMNEQQIFDMNNSNQFFRRPDLTPSIRLYIAAAALMAQVNGTWGKLTELSRQFMISRTFVYTLIATLEESSFRIFADNHSQPTVDEKKLAFYYMLSLRLEGRCSLESISTIMNRFGKKFSSIGSISQYLNHFGSLLPNTLSTEGTTQMAIFLCDEIFSKSVPILVTVEPISSAILKIELADTRKAEDWKKHWKCLEKNGFYALYLVSDEGIGLCTAHEEQLGDIMRQPDTYHAIAHRLGLWCHYLESVAYKAIEEEHDCWKKLDSAKSDRVINKRVDKYVLKERDTIEKIEIYENFCYLYQCLVEELKIFDTTGNLRNRKKAEGNIHAALDLLETLKNVKLTKVVEKIRRTMPDLLNYFDTAQSIVSDLRTLSIDEDALRVLCLAWQWGKEVIKAKNAKARNYRSMQEKFYLELSECCIPENYDLIKKQVFMKLDHIVQSSAMVECINSIIRPYLNTSKNHVTQDLLNLIMFYHNHRRYINGKRKGKTPFEILTGKKQEKDWIELLFDIIQQKDPSFFPQSIQSQ